MSSKDRLAAFQAAQGDLRRHRPGLEYLRALLQKAKSEIARDGYPSNESRNKIYNTFSLWDHSFALTCRCARLPETKAEGARPEEVVDQQTDQERTLLVGLIDDRLERLKEFGGCAAERENLAGDAEARSFSLPPADATDKLLRYEAHLDRQLYRAMDQMERLQRQRRGENVPPPLNVNLGRGR